MKPKKFIIIVFICVFIFLFLSACINRSTQYITLEIPESAQEEVENSPPKIEATSNKLELAEKNQNLPLEGKNLLPFRGIDFYPKPYSYSTEEAYQSLDILLKIKEVNWIQIRFFLYQDDLTSNKINVDVNQDEIIINLIKKIHESGRKVALMPHLFIDMDKFWGAKIKPANEKEWFNSYQQAIVHYAVLAQSQKVELFSVGNEMISLWDRNEDWQKIIESVRNVYSGKVTCKMNSWWQVEYFDKVLDMKWMSDLDYIGIAPYFDLTNKKDPTLEELKKGWSDSRHGFDVVEELESICQKFQKDMIFLEMGYRSIDGTNIEPWNGEQIVPRGSSTLSKADQQEQAIATQALFDVFFNKPWFKGVFWYFWPTSIIVDPNDTSWSIPDKLVEKVIWDNFSKEISQ